MTGRKAWDHGGKSRHARGYGRDHEKMRAHLLATVILCEECRRQGRTTKGEIADHILPIAAGGTHDRSNYQLLCKQCDREKLAKDNGRIASKRKPRIGLDGWPIEE